MLIGVAALLGSTGCRQRGAKSYVIGVVLKDNTSSYFQDMEKGARKAAKEGNADILVLAPEKRQSEPLGTSNASEPDKQSLIIEDLIGMNVNALCVAPEHTESCISSLGKATKQKIPVILMDSDINRDKAAKSKAAILSLVMGDNYQGGELAGKYIAEKISGNGTVAVMEGTPHSFSGVDRRNGFLEAMKKYPGVQVVYSKPGYYKRSRGFEIGLELIKHYPQLKGIFAFDDMMAIGVSDSLIISGDSSNWVIVGFDATAEGKRAILEGRINASVFNNPSQIGYLAVKYALMALRGEKVPQQYLIKTELVTKESLSLPFE